MEDARIVVSVRIRPPLGEEVYNALCLRKAQNGHAVVLRPEESSHSMGEAVSFDFDFVFDETDTQEGIYEECVQEMVDSAIGGSNSTVFAYGQTGSGKTFTILGNTLSEGEGGVGVKDDTSISLTEDLTTFSAPTMSAGAGMFNRIFADLFRYRRSVRPQMHMRITLGIIELYVDDVLDLLANRNKLKLREAGDETFALGITTVEVESMKEVLTYFRVANEFRSVSATKMNETSSRSHALFFIDLYQFPVAQFPVCPPLSSILDANNIPLAKGTPGMIRSRISLVDLAGSERVKKSGAEGQRMKEAQAINKSLSSLGTVINAMYTKNPHIPFRESKLTRLLKPSFIQSQSRVLLMGQASPPSSSASETLGTLRFCDRVKGLRPPDGITFLDPEQEKAYLSSKRVNHALCADMRVASLMYYHHPVRLRALAEEKGQPMEAVRMEVEPSLRNGLQARAEMAETALLTEYQNTVHLQNVKEVEAFILKMNEAIEEYEQIAREAKAAKKAWKKTKEEQEKSLEEVTHETKKAKKSRLKAEQKLQEKKEEVGALTTSLTHDFDGDDEDNMHTTTAAAAAEDKASLFTEAYSEQLTKLGEFLHQSVAECGAIQSTYISRLRQTQQLRAEVRRLKLNTSEIVADSTVIADLLSFMISRAVDISRGKIPEKLPWSFEKNVDGFSAKLKGPYDFYPPLLPRVKNSMHKRHVPLKVEAHKRTFLSSDDSDGELSHYPNETRRRRVFGDGRGSVVEEMQMEDIEGEGDGKKPLPLNTIKDDNNGSNGGSSQKPRSSAAAPPKDWAAQMYERQIREEEAENDAEGSSMASSDGDGEEEVLSESKVGEGKPGTSSPDSRMPLKPLGLPASSALSPLLAASLKNSFEGASSSAHGWVSGGEGEEATASSLPEGAMGSGETGKREGERKRKKRSHKGAEHEEDAEGVKASPSLSNAREDMGSEERMGKAEEEAPVGTMAGGERRRHRRHRHRENSKEEDEEGVKAGKKGSEEDEEVVGGEKKKEEDHPTEDPMEGSQASPADGLSPKKRKLLGNGKSVAGILEVIHQRRRRRDGTVQDGAEEKSKVGDGKAKDDANDSKEDSSESEEEEGGAAATGGKKKRTSVISVKKENSGSFSSISGIVKNTKEAIDLLKVGKPTSTAPPPAVRQSSPQRLNERTTRLQLMRVYDSPTLVSDLIKFLRGGTVMVKHGRLGKPHRRLFWVSSSKGKPELLWMDPEGKDDSRSSLHLNEVAYIKLGCFGKVFKRHAIKQKSPSFFLCFTIGLTGRDRTVDVVADSLADFEAWVVGLSWMVGVDPCWGGKPDISKEPGFETLSFFESTTCETNFVMPSEYLTLKQAVVNRRAEVKAAMEKHPDDLQLVEELLDLIHPPQFNEHGAFLFTKGELRFLCPDIKLDIFRISYIWILFEQMGLVFDPNFSLPTSFGITNRE